MATTTNYIQDLASMRQFIRSLTFGNHNRGKVNARGIKGSQHDDIIRRLDYFGIIPHMYTQRIGKASIHHLNKDDFIDGYNYLNSLYELYAAVPEQIFVQLCILHICIFTIFLFFSPICISLTSFLYPFSLYFSLILLYFPIQPNRHDFCCIYCIYQ